MTGDISFASFNLYNFQEAGKKMRGRKVPQKLYDQKVAWTSDMIGRLDADVIAFQELWNPKCLQDVFSAFPDYKLIFIADSWYDIAVAMAVRPPWKLKAKKLHKEFPFKSLYKAKQQGGEDDEVDVRINRFSRTVIEATLENPASDAPDVTVFAAHLKSKLPTHLTRAAKNHQSAMGAAVSTIRRTAEAAALRCILTDKMKRTDRPVVVLGDMNDDPRSNTLALLTEQPSLMPTARGADVGLYSALQLQQLRSFRDVFYTHDFNRLKDTLDHILVSEQFFEPSTDALWRHTETKVWNDYLEDDAKYTSDHGIIRAGFKWV
ncbi:endonuclease/exonuclease/phosphatase family protein [Kordiimonas marina]|uniref:endonuclease/exonuclease/phosphatase family protein n=1 Tax=Kordiimonas marina TaxID=2872312 RepID=UPI001FF2CFC2|nr:endonuclease/exonuclease/phosphatase family protein [Kordiimonas marina]MCJ9430704.1 endonuclease/exonuclease/phosphatase family protein [Kordiimonas marina]